jgi:hypothetical protein
MRDQRSWTWTPRLFRWMWERSMPGAFVYFNARTRYIDEVLLREAAQGIDQLVVLGVGFDSRSLRFAPQLGAARVFEVDRPEVLARRAERLRGISQNPHAVGRPHRLRAGQPGGCVDVEGVRHTRRAQPVFVGGRDVLPARRPP